MKIGILLADHVNPELAARHGQYDGMFGRLLRAADPALVLASYNVEQSHYPASLDECDGYLITGSRHSVYDGLGWITRLERFVVELARQRRPLFAVCFGHQLVARALGGQAKRAPGGWTLGVQTTTIGSPFPWVTATTATTALSLVHSHQDQVTRLPADAVLVGSNQVCPISMYRIGNHVMSCQGHPEFSHDYARDLYDSRRTIFGDDLWREARGSLAGDTDEALVAAWALNFFSEAGRPR